MRLVLVLQRAQLLAARLRELHEHLVLQALLRREQALLRLLQEAPGVLDEGDDALAVELLVRLQLQAALAAQPDEEGEVVRGAEAQPAHRLAQEQLQQLALQPLALVDELLEPVPLRAEDDLEHV